MHFPIRMTETYTGAFVGITWHATAGERAWEIIEAKAAKHATERGREIDIETGAVTKDGQIVEWERAGVRIKPDYTKTGCGGKCGRFPCFEH